MVSDRDVAYLDVARLLVAGGVDGLQRQLATPVIDVMSSASSSSSPTPR
jgi:hypothetical protein